MSNENAKIDPNYKHSMTAVTDDIKKEIRRLLVDPATGRLKVQISGANKSKKQEVFNATGNTLSLNRFVTVVGDNTTYLIPNVNYVSSLEDIPVGFLTVDFPDGSRAEPLIRGRVQITGFDTTSSNIGDPVYSDENGYPTLFPTGLEVGQVLTPALNGVIFINLGAKTDIVEKMTTATDPATNAAVTTDIVDHFIGTIITLTTIGNSQTIASPTLISTIGKKFTVVNNDTSTNSIIVNGQTIEVGEATTFIWDGSAWNYIDINENLWEIVGDTIRPIIDGNNLDMRTGTITSPIIYANTILEKTLNSGVTIETVLIKDGLVDGRDISADGSALDSHISNISNPHGVTKTQVGLSNVDNIQQMPLSYLDIDGTLAANSDVKVCSQKAVKTYVETMVSGLWDDRGSYDASGNVYPSTGGSGTAGAIKKGDIWTVSVAGTLGGVAVNIGDTVRALIDTPAQTISNWAILENNIGYVPENITNKVTSLSGSSTDAQYPSAKLVYDQLVLKENFVDTSAITDKAFKFWNANKQFTEIIIGNGGYSANLYLTNLDSATDASYKQLSYTNDASSNPASVVVNNNELLLKSYIFDTTINTTTVPAGLFTFNLWAKVSSANGVTTLRADLFKRTSGGVETVLFSKYSDEINDTSFAEHKIQYDAQQYTINATDKLGVKIYAKTTSGNNITVTVDVGDGSSSYVTSPLATRHEQLRGRDQADQHPISAITGLQTALDAKENVISNGTGTLANGNTTVTITDAKVISTSFVDVYFDSPLSVKGKTTVTTSNGSFVVTSDTAQTADMTFRYTNLIKS